MRILMVGAGGIGGYFGGRLLEAGRDVTFLVRPARARKLAETGLVVRSPFGDLHLAAPPTVLAGEPREPFDAVLLSCKAYDLEDAVEAFAPAVGPDTMVLPLLNGMAHFDALDRRFGAGRVLGGSCFISSALDAQGAVVHFNRLHGLVFGERTGEATPRIRALEAQLCGAGFDGRLSGDIVQELWEKWVFIASAAGITCLLRGSVGDIVAAGNQGLAVALMEECASVAAAHGHAPRAQSLEKTRAILTEPGSPMTSSMFRDLESGGRIEGDHLIGDLLRRGAGPLPMLAMVDASLRTYGARRARG
ncbi:2-dehydropantoate 2-reductase [Mesoterricola silvestris]|uniref:2-dehydropantoate 2-reductase n=1 Tax=Mesoterricola silvestris TaxID=2927979 RepID=A0AA48KA16_9BACT|nr:2-dehydropantoate 2-reductase [Mesoterricola silvestris]BDU74136.1 2-dehydropantoate 2-reductase [Mesoterricola silvestris]